MPWGMSLRRVSLLLLLGSFSFWLGCAAAPPRLRPAFPDQASRSVSRGRVLFVLSAAETQELGDGTKRKTGTFLGELYEPYSALSKDGYQVIVATISGARPAIDPESLNEKYWDDPEHLRSARRLVEESSRFREPLSLQEALATAESFQGIVVPGGQGVMVDLFRNPELQALLTHFGERDQPVGLICHAPALLTVLPEQQRLARRTVTSVSSFEEFYIETFVMGAKARVRGIADRLEEAGYEHEAAFPGSEHALRDCNLVTSQNPFSTKQFNALYLAALADYRRGGRCEERE
jgi:putative intracellular protease/amidase